jgi:formamidopyrimidine-DNA glycosylase
MPELPEVQTIVNDLQILTNDTIISFWTNFKKAIKSDDFEENIIGKKIKNIERIGKNIVIRLSDDHLIIVHLKMTGKLLTNKLSSNLPSKHLHHIFHLRKNGSIEFHDIRKFATIELINNEKLSAMIALKGINPFSKDFTVATLKKIISNKKTKNIKSFLMDQTAISGIGNIYASEIPFHAKLNPLRKIDTLTVEEIKTLHSSILKILTKAIKMRGTSISDYRDAKGEKGGFQNELKVYGKAGKICEKCDTMIEKVIVEQRSTFFCSHCQI